MKSWRAKVEFVDKYLIDGLIIHADSRGSAWEEAENPDHLSGMEPTFSEAEVLELEEIESDECD
jgi:hypothetical protein